MRAVNLLPDRYRPARATGRLRGSSYVSVAVLAVLLAMVVGYVVTNNQIKDAQEETNQAQAEAQEAEARAAALGAFGNFLQIKEARETAVKGLALTRFDYERLMREMALVLPDDVFLTSFSAAVGSGETAAQAGVTADGPQLSLGGCAPSHRGVAETVVRLRKLHNAVDVTLNSSARGGGDGGGCRVSWSAVVAFEAENAPADRRPVPARLGGGA